MGKQKGNFFPLLLLIGSAAFLSLYFLWPEKPVVKKTNVIRADNPQAQALVNKHLFLMSQTQELEQKKREAENAYQAVQVGDSIWPKGISRNKELGVDHSADRNENSAFEDLHRYKKEFHTNNPDNVIQGQISDEIHQQEYAEEYRAEYARQFVENARKHGYHVELNSDYVVVKVTPIRREAGRDPSAESLHLGPQAK